METKICSKCRIKKELHEYTKDLNTSDGLKCKCKQCCKEYYENNKNKILNQQKDHYKINHEKKNEKNKKWNEAHHKELIEYRKKRYHNNIEINKIRSKEYYENNKDKAQIKRERFKKRNPNYGNEYYHKVLKEKYKTDTQHKLVSNVRRRVRSFLKSKNVEKRNKTFEIVGCSPEFLKGYLEKQFTEGMTWKNYGYYGWHIDHKIPLDCGKTEDEIYKLCYYTNLQPMWWLDNFKKGKKICTQEKIY